MFEVNIHGWIQPGRQRPLQNRNIRMEIDPFQGNKLLMVKAPLPSDARRNPMEVQQSTDALCKHRIARRRTGDCIGFFIKP